MKTLLTISLLSMTIFSWGQGKANKELLQFLKSNRIDTFLLVKTGCPNCSISYEDSVNPIDTVTIWLLFKKQGQQSLISFSDISKTEKFRNIETDIFRFVVEKRLALRLKDKYYQEQKLLKFQPPCLATFPYEKIQIQVGQFKHMHTLVDREMDDCGTTLTAQEWFRIEIEILKMFDRLKTSSDKKQRTTMHPM